MKPLNRLLTILFPALFIIAILFIAPINDVFEYDPDEGINVMKALLHLKGYALYDEIWSDQPPLLTWFMSNWFKIFGPSVYHGRLLILIFSALLLWAFYQVIRYSWGNLCALLSVLMLLFTAHYIRLSVSIMVGIPSLTFAVVSMYFLTLYKKYHTMRWLVLSGIFIALSLQTKLFTAFLLPLLIFEILQNKWEGFKRDEIIGRYILPVLMWTGAFFITFVSISALFSVDMNQLFQPHLKAKGATAFKELDSFYSLRKMIVQDYDYFLLALIGIVILVRRKKWDAFQPLIWFLLAFILLLNHKPVWYHHYLLLSIPLAWLAGICLGDFFRKKLHRDWIPKFNLNDVTDAMLRWMTAGVIILVVVLIPSKYERIDKEIKSVTFPQDRHSVELLMKYSPHTQWVVTDRQIIPFYANLLVPPELAVTSLKRRLTGQLSPGYVLNILQKYKPEQILFNRYSAYPNKIMVYINEHYLNIYHNRTTRLYIRKDIIK